MRRIRHPQMVQNLMNSPRRTTLTHNRPPLFDWQIRFPDIGADIINLDMSELEKCLYG